MRLIGYIGIILVIIGIVAITFGGTVVVSKNEKESAWHYVAIGVGLLFSIIGIIMIIVGGSNGTLKGYKLISVPVNMAKNIEASIKSYLKGGPKPCFIDAPDTGPGLWSRFKSGLSSAYGSVKSGVSSAYGRIRRGKNGETVVVEAQGVEMAPVA